MSKLEATAYNYGAKIKGRAMSNLGSVANTIRKLQAENNRLREALEHIAAGDFAELAAENDMLREEIKRLNGENDRLISDLARVTLAKEGQ